MRHLGLTGLLYILSLTAGCFALPPADSNQPSAAQQELISSWHRCVDSNLSRLKAEGHSPGTSVDHTLIACQGHREDVLATFPERLQQSLNKFMIQQTWESGYAAWSTEVREVAQSASRLQR